MKHITTHAVAAAILCTASTAALAQERVKTVPVRSTDRSESLSRATAVPYTYASLGYRKTTYDFSGGGDVDADGFVLDGSYMLPMVPNVFIVGGYATSETDPDPSGDTLEITEISLGGGYRMALTPGVDLAGSLRVVKGDFEDNTGGSEDDTGFKLAVGVRAMVIEHLEARGEVVHADVDDFPGIKLISGTYLTGSALYQIPGLPQLSAGAELSFGGDSTSYGILGRWAF